MELLLSHLAAFLSFLPDPPTGTPNELAKDGIDFFQLWISRIGGIVAFIGAVKFALGVKDDEAKEQLDEFMYDEALECVNKVIGAMGDK